MKYLILIMLLMISYSNPASDNKQPNVDLAEVEIFLSRLYVELKCPSYPMQNSYKLEVCINSLTYDLDDGRILFAFTAFPENNRVLKGFDHLNKSERRASLFELTQTMAKFTGIIPVNKNLYMGAIQSTQLTHVYDSKTIKKNNKIRDFVRNNAVVGIRVMDGGMRYLAFLDLNRDMHYKEGDMVSILDFEAKSKRKGK